VQSVALVESEQEEERTSIARFLSGLNMEVRDKIELFPYRDLDDLV